MTLDLAPLRVGTAALAVMLGLVATGVAVAEADGPDSFRVVGVAKDDVLNLRQEPSAAAMIIGRIPPDATGLRNLGCRGGQSLAEWQAASEAERAAAVFRRWCRVEYRGTTGWVAGRFLAE